MNATKNFHVDLSQLEAISCGDHDFIIDMIDMYFNVLSKELDKIYLAAEVRDSADLKAYIHKVKPNLKIFGVMKLLEPLVAVEHAAENDVLPEDLPEIMDMVKKINREVESDLNYILNNLKVAS